MDCNTPSSPLNRNLDKEFMKSPIQPGLAQQVTKADVLKVISERKLCVLFHGHLRLGTGLLAGSDVCVMPLVVQQVVKGMQRPSRIFRFD